MPRAQTSQITQLVGAFRTMPLDKAEIAFDLIRDEMRGRRQKSEKAKAAQPVKAAAPAKKKAKKKAKTNGAVDQPAIPFAPPVQDADVAAESGD